MSDVYVVRFSEEEREAAINFSGTMPWLAVKIESARPEYPERQAALEALAEAISCLGDWEFSNFEYFQFNEKMEALGSAIRKFRSLEGK